MTEPSFRKMLTGIAEFYCACDYLTRQRSIDMMRTRVPPWAEVLLSEGSSTFALLPPDAHEPRIQPTNGRDGRR